MRTKIFYDEVANQFKMKNHIKLEKTLERFHYIKKERNEKHALY